MPKDNLSQFCNLFCYHYHHDHFRGLHPLFPFASFPVPYLFPPSPSAAFPPSFASCRPSAPPLRRELTGGLRPVSRHLVASQTPYPPPCPPGPPSPRQSLAAA